MQNRKKSSRWFQPIWKILVKMGIISPGIGMKIKNLWNHHLDVLGKKPHPSMSGPLKKLGIGIQRLQLSASRDQRIQPGHLTHQKTTGSDMTWAWASIVVGDAVKIWFPSHKAWSQHNFSKLRFVKKASPWVQAKRSESLWTSPRLAHSVCSRGLGGRANKLLMSQTAKWPNWLRKKPYALKLNAQVSLSQGLVTAQLFQTARCVKKASPWVQAKRSESLWTSPRLAHSVCSTPS